ncbi:MAG: response regulator, partial [Proteobacteria bacterium]|nr:response regulator [Pseudomonadota bacterium]
AEVIGKNPRILSSGLQDAEFYRHMWASLQGQGHWSGEMQNKRKNGELYPERISITAIKDKDNKTSHYISHFTDITEIKKREFALSHAQKMEAVGQLTGGIAHDFNNLLSIIKGNLRFLKEDIGETDAGIDELFEDALSAVDDGAELTQRLLGFSRNQPLQTEIKNVSDSIEKFIRFLSRTIGEKIELVFEPPEADLMISVDASQLENALLNLCLNARDAMPEGGLITIEATPYHHDGGNDLYIPEGHYIKISIIDNGSGIDEKDLPHVFEPFFTTKEVGRGSGLGLSMVYGFTQQSNGTCQISSRLGAGTRVSMYFPEMPEELVSEAKLNIEGSVARGSEVILVVEDEPRVRRATVRDLKGLGYKTLEAENADVARTMIESGEPIDLLFSDVVMPGEMDGRMLAVWTAENFPQIKVVLTSGYSKGKADVSKDKGLPFPMMNKPYSIEKLAEQIRSALD